MLHQSHIEGHITANIVRPETRTYVYSIKPATRLTADLAGESFCSCVCHDLGGCNFLSIIQICQTFSKFPNHVLTPIPVSPWGILSLGFLRGPSVVPHSTIRMEHR
jgi:hypothetical protein